MNRVISWGNVWSLSVMGPSVQRVLACRRNVKHCVSHCATSVGRLRSNCVKIAALLSYAGCLFSEALAGGRLDLAKFRRWGQCYVQIAEPHNKAHCPSASNRPTHKTANLFRETGPELRAARPINYNLSKWLQILLPTSIGRPCMR